MRRSIPVALILSALLFGAATSVAQTASPFGSILPAQTPPESVHVEIVQVDNSFTSDSIYAIARKSIETGWKATVQGTISQRDYQVFVLVHPLLSDTWTVQSSVARPSKTGTWRTTCLLGTERKGKDEDYEVIAVASFKRDQYRPGQRIPANLFPPTDMPQSDIILTRRVRSPSP